MNSSILQKIVSLFLFIQGLYIFYNLRFCIINFTPQFFLIIISLLALFGGLAIIMASIGILFKKHWSIILYWVFVFFLIVPFFQRVALFTIAPTPYLTTGGILLAQPMSATKALLDYCIKIIPFVSHYILVTYFTVKYWNNWKKEKETTILNLNSEKEG